MHDAFSRYTPLSSVINRKGHSPASTKFSPSFGVHRGLIKDPNWPPPEFPESGSAASRRFRRVAMAFEVELRGAAVPVTGDISEGGAMFIFERKVETQVVDVVVQGKVARAEVLSVSKKGNAFAHHCRFIDASEARPVWKAVSST